MTLRDSLECSRWNLKSSETEKGFSGRARKSCSTKIDKVYRYRLVD